MRLVLFDCDGTLADSQDSIARAMDEAFKAADRPAPGRARTLSIVGLSLPQAIHALAPEETTDVQVRIAESYRAAAQRIRLTLAEDPLFAGADAAVRALAASDDMLLGMATGKSLRGVHRLIAHHGWEGFFSTLQTADGNPSKPHPGMIERALSETGAEAANTVMIGDTTFDMEMARAAGVRAIAVSWGYHPVADLRAAGAQTVVDDFAALLAELQRG
jgi:phosphoglycolate phosphatase